MCRRTCIARHLYLALACRSTLASTHTHTLTHSHIRTYIIDLYIRLVYIAVDKCVNFRTLSLLAEWFASVHTQTYTYTYNVYYIYYIYICTSPLPVQPFASVHAQTHAHTHAHIRNRFIYTRTQTRTRICIHAIYLHTHVHVMSEMYVGSYRLMQVPWNRLTCIDIGTMLLFLDIGAMLHVYPCYFFPISIGKIHTNTRI